MKKLLVFGVMFLVLMGCSREDQVLTPTNEGVVLEKGGIVQLDPVPQVQAVNPADQMFIIQEYELNVLPGGDYEMLGHVDFLPFGRRIEVVIVIFEEEYVDDMVVFRLDEPNGFTWIGQYRIRVVVPNDIRNFKCAYVWLDKD